MDHDGGATSVTIRSGPPEDGGEPDARLDVWAGELPLRTVALEPVADPALRSGIPLATHLERCSAGMAARLAPPLG
ncbi:MAG: hypothetical protein ACYCXY_02005 [Acidimicrobiales bacterium]